MAHGSTRHILEHEPGLDDPRHGHTLRDLRRLLVFSISLPTSFGGLTDPVPPIVSSAFGSSRRAVDQTRESMARMQTTKSCHDV
jgi:hypothetical protein